MQALAAARIGGVGFKVETIPGTGGFEELESRSNFESGPTYAVSVFHGGQWVNCVPMMCTAQALCVARDLATFDEIGRVMVSLAGTRADVRIEVEKGPVRPLWSAQAETMALYERAHGIAQGLGFELPHAQHGGGSDGNFTGALGVATLDGLGAMGHGAHTHQEHILVSSTGAPHYTIGAPYPPTRTKDLVIATVLMAAQELLLGKSV